MKPLKPALQLSQGRSYNWSGAKLLNCFAEKADGDKLENFALMGTPGLTLWYAVGTGPIRASIVVAGVLYVVSGNTLFSVTSTGVTTSLGTIAGTGPARIAANYTEVAIAANGTGYVFSGTLQTPVPFSVSDVCYADGFIVWLIEDSEQFLISSLDDALTYDAADIASIEGSPDNVVGMVNDHREIQFYGETTTEIFYNSGAAFFPFERQGNAFIERGCFDRDSVVKIDNTVTFVGNDRIVYSLGGYIPQRISTHAIEYQLRDATYVRAWTYTQEGHKFYVMECDRGTFLFDQATGAWHQRKSYGSAYWRCNGVVAAYDLLLFTDRANGNLYTASNEVFTENSETISVQITLPTIDNGTEQKTMYAFQLMLETGQGNAAADDPQIVLEYSNDGGHTWSNEMWRAAGVQGEYQHRVIWRKLGQFYTRQMRLTMTDPFYRIAISYWHDTR